MALLLSIILRFASASAFAADSTLTLQTALQEAVEHNPGLARAQAVEDEASWKSLETLSNHIPRVSISASHLFSVKYQTILLPNGGVFDAIYPKTILSIGASWTVFDGLQTINSFSSAKDLQHAAEREVSRTRFQLENEVKLRFYQSLAAQNLKRVAEQNVKTLRDHLARTGELLKQGQSTRFDLLRTQTQLEEAVPEEINAEDELQLAKTALARLEGKDSEARELAGSLPEPPQDPALFGADKLKLESGGRDDVEALLLRAEAADRTRSSAYGALLPRISLTAQQDFYNNQTFGLSDPYRTAYSVGITASWTLFDGGYSFARLKEAQAYAAQAEASARAAQLRAPGELDTWRRKLIYNISLFSARKRSIESAQESLRLAKLGYGAGTRTNTDVLDAELDLFRAAEGKVRAQIGALESLLNLELALGRRLTL